MTQAGHGDPGRPAASASPPREGATERGAGMDTALTLLGFPADATDRRWFGARLAELLGVHGREGAATSLREVLDQEPGRERDTPPGGTGPPQEPPEETPSQAPDD